jgi:hypothetical protein
MKSSINNQDDAKIMRNLYKTFGVSRSDLVIFPGKCDLSLYIY